MKYYTLILIYMYLISKVFDSIIKYQKLIYDFFFIIFSQNIFQVNTT